MFTIPAQMSIFPVVWLSRLLCPSLVPCYNNFVTDVVNARHNLKSDDLYNAIMWQTFVNTRYTRYTVMVYSKLLFLSHCQTFKLSLVLFFQNPTLGLLVWCQLIWDSRAYTIAQCVDYKWMLLHIISVLVYRIFKKQAVIYEHFVS